MSISPRCLISSAHRMASAALSLLLCAALGANGLIFGQEDIPLRGELKNISKQAVEMEKAIRVKGADEMVNLSFRGVSVEDALRALGKKGGFNVAINEEVSGVVSLDLNGVTLQEALEAIRTQNNLNYALKSDDTLMVTTASATATQTLGRTHTELIPLKYTNATVVAQILNTSVFSPASQAQVAGGPGGQVFNKITPDFRTNTLIFVGTPSEIETAKQYVSVLDVPRESKTWRLSHADAVDVATQLVSGLFNEGIGLLNFPDAGGGAGGGAGGAGGAQQQQGVGQLPSTLRVQVNSITEGTGASTAGSSGGGATEEGVTGEDSSLRTLTKEESLVDVLPNGAIIIPDTRLNTVTLYGTAKQVALAEQMIAALDRRAPQVVIETMMIEVTEGAQRELGFFNAIDGRSFNYSINNPQNGLLDGLAPFTNPIGVPSVGTDLFNNLFRWTTRQDTNTSYDFYYQLNALINSNRAKVLANPSVVTLHDNESVISIVDELVCSVEIVVDNNGVNPPQATPNICDVGVVLNILPKIGADGSVNMRIKPTLSSFLRNAGNANFPINLISKREAVAQSVRLRDGQSFVLGGLIQETDANAVNKSPLLGDLPILGALARSSVRNKRKTELIIIITPHIIADDNERVAERGNNHDTLAVEDDGSGGAEGYAMAAIGGEDHSGNYLPSIRRPATIVNTSSPSIKTGLIPESRRNYIPSAKTPPPLGIPQYQVKPSSNQRPVGVPTTAVMSTQSDTPQPVLGKGKKGLGTTAKQPLVRVQYRQKDGSLGNEPDPALAAPASADGKLPASAVPRNPQVDAILRKYMKPAS